MNDFNLIRSNIFKALNIHPSYDSAIILAGFKERYQYLLQYKDLKPLLSKFSQDNPITGENLFDYITEFNLAYEFLKKNSLSEIEYEPSVSGNDKKPDFKIVAGNLLLYIQVKRMRKSVDFEKQKKITLIAIHFIS